MKRYAALGSVALLVFGVVLFRAYALPAIAGAIEPPTLKWRGHTFTLSGDVTTRYLKHMGFLPLVPGGTATDGSGLLPYTVYQSAPGGYPAPPDLWLTWHGKIVDYGIDGPLP